MNTKWIFLVIFVLLAPLVGETISPAQALNLYDLIELM